MANETRLGLKGKLYVGAAGATPATELTAAREVNVTLAKDVVDDTCRAAQGWKSEIGSLKSLRLEFTLLNKAGDQGVASIRAAFFGDTLIAMYAKDFETGEGPDADFEVTEFRRAEPMGDVQTYAVTVVSNTTNRVPSWV